MRLNALKAFHQITDIYAYIGLVFIEAELASYFSTYIVVALELHVFTDLLSSKSYGIQADIFDFSLS